MQTDQQKKAKIAPFHQKLAEQFQYNSLKNQTKIQKFEPPRLFEGHHSSNVIQNDNISMMFSAAYAAKIKGCKPPKCV